MDCTICFEDLKVGPVIVLPCDHKFHELCVVRWAQYNMSCPNCRAEFLIYVTPQRDPLRIVVLLLAIVYLALFVMFCIESMDLERFRS